ncbi:MAG: hypothetical protein Q8S09_14000 [Hyphomonas sp.]|nr:hypothetical protein [Hyphomonas sp.]
MITDAASTNSVGRTKSGYEKRSFNQESEGGKSDHANGAADAGSMVMEKGQQLAEVASVKARKASNMMVSRIKKNPLAAVGIALGAGFGFALLRR